MATYESAPRGPYAKGLRKRAEILDAALLIIAREGYAKTTLKEVADAVGLSQAGVLHHFSSKEDLFTAVLVRRDERDMEERLAASTDGVTRPVDLRNYPELLRHNTTVPGLIELFVRLEAEASDPTHPAHAYFAMRNDRFPRYFAHAIARHQERGEFTNAIAPSTAAVIIQAVADGLQLRWLLDKDFDMVGVFRDLLGVLMPGQLDDPAPETPTK